METRREPRVKHAQVMEISVEGEMTQGNIRDITSTGLQVFCYHPLEQDVQYTVQFTVYRHGTPGLKDEDWTRDGYVKWMRPLDEGCLIGIQFVTPIDNYDPEKVNQILTIGEFCSLEFLEVLPGAEDGVDLSALSAALAEKLDS